MLDLTPRDLAEALLFFAAVLLLGAGLAGLIFTLVLILTR